MIELPKDEVIPMLDRKAGAGISKPEDLTRYYASVCPSKQPGAGLGVHAARDIHRGTLIWLRSPCNTLDVPRAVFEHIRLAAAVHAEWQTLLDAILHFAYHDARRDVGVLPLDDARFTNHSDGEGANCESVEWWQEKEGTWIQGSRVCAEGGVAAGEELLEDYRAYPASPWGPKPVYWQGGENPGDGGDTGMREVDVRWLQESGTLARMTVTSGQLEVIRGSRQEDRLDSAILALLSTWGKPSTSENGDWELKIPSGI